MTTFATQQESDRRLAELDDRTREAWERYHAEVRELEGPSYAIAEPAAWESLQETLDEVGAQRTEILAHRAD
ncbi:hypothetical protein [Paraconexibacter sp.]|uniref:hypothetical protein n=1 Tax=Paraconexibacter sp. TaxID=2949640 RepID=UPI003565839A